MRTKRRIFRFEFSWLQVIGGASAMALVIALAIAMSASRGNSGQ
jgi:hypothetical protein